MKFSNDIRCVFIGDSDFLAYDEKVAGLFNNYSTSGNVAIHQIEKRKLTEEELEELLEKVDFLEEEEIEDRLPNLRERNLIDDIQVYYPEIRYIVKALYRINEPDKIVTASEVEAKKGKKRIEKKKEKKRDEKQTQQDKEREADEEAQEAQEGVNLQESIDEGLKERKEAQDDRERAVEEEEEKLKKQGKMGSEGKEKFGGGWKGLLFDMFNAVKRGDPEKYKEKKKLQKFLRDNWKTFKANEKLIKENEELVDVLRESANKGKINPEHIAVFNELLERDPAFLKEVDFDQKDVTISMPLNSLIDEEEHVGAVKSESDLLDDFLRKKYFVEKDIDPKIFKAFDVDKDTSKAGKREVTIKTDLASGMDIINKLGLKSSDLLRKL